jgi:hypothetical protein
MSKDISKKINCFTQIPDKVGKYSRDTLVMGQTLPKFPSGGSNEGERGCSPEGKCTVEVTECIQ